MANSRYDIDPDCVNQKAIADVLKHVRLLYVTEARFNTDWHSTLHSHPCTELFYCVRGIGEFRMKDRAVAVGSDDLIIISPNIEHTECSVASNPLEYIVLGVEGLDFSFEDTACSCTVLNYRDMRSEIVFLLRMLVREAKQHPTGWEQLCQHLLEVMLTLVLRHTQLRHTQLGPCEEPSRRTNKECAAARRYIDEHFAEPISLALLADIAHVNKYYLVHAFHKEYGVSPINYLIERRLRESKYLLANTDYSLSQISHLLGFSSPSYFSQSFRRFSGQSPMEYRKQCRERQP